jgi:ribosomal-protein-alanine N-acetyltransferase
VLKNYENHESSVLAIDRKDESILIGTMGYLNWSNDHKRIEIGYALSRFHWNNGYATEATKAVIDYFFTNSDLVRIEARCRTENIASARVLEKAGMEFEGILRKNVFTKGKYVDLKIYSIIIRDEWRRENNH